MITLLKWIGAAGAGALFAVIALFYTAQNQQKTDTTIDLKSTEVMLDYGKMMDRPFFTPNKKDREELRKRNEALSTEIEKKKEDSIKRQKESDEFVKDAKTALNEMDKEMREDNKKLTHK